MALTDYSIDTTDAGLDPKNIERKRLLAEALSKQGSASTPIQSPWQGFARLGDALVGSLQERKLDQQESARRKSDASIISAYPGAPPASQPPAASGTPLGNALTGSAPPAADTTGKIYNNDEPSPLDPPSGGDRQKMIATILAEESTPQGQSGVANVIRNRAVDGGYGGDTPSAVVQSPNQFEPWNTEAGKARMAAALQNPTQVAAANAAIDGAYGAGGKAPDDPTEGKTMFYAPGAQAALGRSAPSWAEGPGQMLGKTAFFDDNSDLPKNAQPAQGMQVAGTPIPDSTPPAPASNQRQQELEMWARKAALSQNPSIRDMGIKTLEGLQKQESHAQETDKDGNVWDVNKQTGQKTIALKAENDPKWGVVGKDKYGQPVYGYPPTREEAAAKAKAFPAEQPSNQPDLTDVHGEEYMGNLKKTDPKMESQVRAIIEGRAPYPTGMLLKTPYGQDLASHVTQADPSFESGNATARVKVRNEFKAGGVASPAGQISAGNTALQHAGEMSDALERMKEGGGVLAGVGSAGIPFVSYGANALRNKSVAGTPEGAALNDFMTAKNHFSEEVTKFYAGSAGSEAERARALANLDAAKSLPELRSAIKTEANLMQGKVNALQERWRNGMGPLVPDFPLISKESQDAVDRVMKRDQASAAPKGAPSPGLIQDGYRFKGGSPGDQNNWERVQ